MAPVAPTAYQHMFSFLRLIEDSLMRHTAGGEVSCLLQCPTPSSLRYNGVADIRWLYVGVTPGPVIASSYKGQAH